MLTGPNFNEKINVLVVEDNPLSARLLQICLGDLGFKKISLAEDGGTGWEMIRKGIETGKPFHLVISDWSMPNMDGIVLLRKVRSQEKTRSLPFVLLTCHSEKNRIKEAMESGVSSFIAKPFDPDSLGDRIAESLSTPPPAYRVMSRG